MTEKFSYQITDDERDYYEWRTEAQQNGLLHDAALAYYISDSKHLYTIAIDGELETAPIFTYRKWLAPNENLDFPVESIEGDAVTEEYDTDAIREMTRSIAAAGESWEGNSDDYIWNGPVYGAISATTDSIGFRLVESDYYSVKSSASKLKDELYRSLYERGLEADAPYLDVVDHINEIDTPLRDKYYQKFEDVLEFHDGPRLAGCSAVTVFNTGDDYVIPIATRSSKVSESAGWKNPVPAGVLQPPRGESEELAEVDSEDISVLTEHILDEFCGTLLNEENQNDGMTDLKALLDTDDATLGYTASGIDCKQTYIQFYGILFIDDPEYYQTYIDGQELGGWETESVELVSVSDSEALKNLLSRKVMNPYNLLGLSEALFVLRDSFDIDLPFDLQRT